MIDAHGYYQSNGQIYANKAEALYASKGTQVTWHFHDNIFSAIDWTICPTGTLKDLYRDRAQQLRDNYDYLIVNFSGGPDSLNILNTFLDNNIKVDEIFTRWAKAERNYRDADPTNFDEENLGSEFEYAVLPVLEKITKTHPDINIVIDDYSEGYTKDLTEEQILESNHYQLMPSFFRFNRKSESELVAERHNKKIGVVYGYDKIRCSVRNGDFYSHFLDCIGGNDLVSGRNFEVFYWSPDFPQLPILQAHLVKEYLKQLPNWKKLSYRQIYTNVCYPDYDVTTFQVNKGWGGLICKSDLWIPKYNPRYFQSWKWNTDQLYNSIDPNFLSYHTDPKLNKIIVGFKPIPSKPYLVEKNCGLPDLGWSSLNL